MYYATSGPRHSVDSAWSIVSMVCSLSRTLRLHREGARTGFDNKTAQRRRAMFWEVYSLDTYHVYTFLTMKCSLIALGFGRQSGNRNVSIFNFHTNTSQMVKRP
ncbi:hypothetical protein C8R44DRAFT_144495 [Mycena epipterygia]|nr:hypothetical protein C8R44DRAFT_144495 [Mycena epipterygia]